MPREGLQAVGSRRMEFLQRLPSKEQEQHEQDSLHNDDGVSAWVVAIALRAGTFANSCATGTRVLH